MSFIKDYINRKRREKVRRKFIEKVIRPERRWADFRIKLRTGQVPWEDKKS